MAGHQQLRDLFNNGRVVEDPEEPGQPYTWFPDKKDRPLIVNLAILEQLERIADSLEAGNADST